MTIEIKDKKKKVLFDSKFIRVIIENNFIYVQEPWCNNQGVAILPYVLKDNQYHFLQIHNENNPAQKKSKVSQYSTITGGLENNQFYTTVVNEMFEETGIDISENVTIDRLGPYSFANKSSDKKWYLYAIDLTNLNLDINQTYYGKGGDGTDFEKGIHANFVNSYTLAGSNDTLSTSIWGRIDLVKRYKYNETQNFLKKLKEKIKEINNINKKIDLRLLFDETFLKDESYVDVELETNNTTVIPNGFPLHYAVDNAYFEIAKFFIDNGANPNIEDIGGTPLQIAIANFNNNIEIVKLLIEKGADVNIKNDNGDSLLDIAVKNDKIEVVKLLLNHSNIDVNIKNDYIKSIFFYSAKNGHINSLKLLIEKGADVNIKNDNGDSLLDIAVKNDKIEVVKLLLNHSNIDVNIKNKYGFTPLHYAVDNAYFEIAKFGMAILFRTVFW
ncbi:ankyrin repeat domain-containing protein [Spiroplasma endosymbiont of Cleonymus obscurus]|uniref:ankyrin repeat domain-containing protein n=1 Tax=Spiroplasma endosymbiont of Cleonymus obscurus TaxID=3066324 RepID=UPI0037DD1996